MTPCLLSRYASICGCVPSPMAPAATFAAAWPVRSRSYGGHDRRKHVPFDPSGFTRPMPEFGQVAGCSSPFSITFTTLPWQPAQPVVTTSGPSTTFPRKLSRDPVNLRGFGIILVLPNSLASLSWQRTAIFWRDQCGNQKALVVIGVRLAFLRTMALDAADALRRMTADFPIINAADRDIFRRVTIDTALVFADTNGRKPPPRRSSTWI